LSCQVLQIRRNIRTWDAQFVLPEM
jgi:hypothetical protein